MTRLAAFIFISISFVQHSFVNAAEVIAEDDVTIRQGTNSTQSQTNLVVKHDGGAGSSSNRAAWIQFDLTGLNADLTASAVFTVTYNTSTSVSLAAFEIEVFGLNSGYLGTTDWDETTLDWDPLPPGATTNLHAVNTSQMTSLGTFSLTLTPDTELTFNIGQLSDFTQADDTVTLALFSNTTDPGAQPLTFYSKESAGAGQSPTLTYAVIPEPGSLMLMFSGFIGLYLLKRRN